LVASQVIRASPRGMLLPSHFSESLFVPAAGKSRAEPPASNVFFCLSYARNMS
jgi:hypothetical protein